jgi:hypothetical protein
MDLILGFRCEDCIKNKGASLKDNFMQLVNKIIKMQTAKAKIAKWAARAQHC